MKYRFSPRTGALGLILLLLLIFVLFVSPKMQTHAAIKNDVVDAKEKLEMVTSDLNTGNVVLDGQATAEKNQPILYLRVISELVKTFYIA